MDEIVVSSEEYLYLPSAEFTERYHLKTDTLYRYSKSPSQLIYLTSLKPFVWKLGPKVKIRNV